MFTHQNNISMRLVLLTLIVFSSQIAYSSNDTIVIKMQYKAKLKTNMSYDEISKLNPEILKFDIIAGDYFDSLCHFRLGIFNENRNKKYNEIDVDYLISNGN